MQIANVLFILLNNNVISELKMIGYSIDIVVYKLLILRMNDVTADCNLAGNEFSLSINTTVGNDSIMKRCV